jgi:hypothetical protein
VERVLKDRLDKVGPRVNSRVHKVLKVLWVPKEHKVHKMVYKVILVLKGLSVNKVLQVHRVPHKVILVRRVLKVLKVPQELRVQYKVILEVKVLRALRELRVPKVLLQGTLVHKEYKEPRDILEHKVTQSLP